MRKLLVTLVHICLLLVTFTLLVCLPTLFVDGRDVGFHVKPFLSQIINVFSSILHPAQLKMTIGTQVRAIPDNVEVFVMQKREYPLFPVVIKPYIYSIGLIFGAFVVSVLFAVISSVGVAMLPRNIRIIIEGFVSILKTVPDVFFIFFIQLLIISVYRNIDFLALNPISTEQNPSIVLPILILSVLPTISLFQLQLLLIGEERKQEYVTFAKARGFSEMYILCRHIFRNVIVSVMNHVQYILLILVTNLFIFEYLFHANGILSIIMSGQDPSVIVYLLLLFIVPIYGVVLFLQWRKEKMYA
ncbi:ABC transporter permease subunit [Bacillus sp. BP-3]|uniref:ABC transporter permease subunit n=1 Tax=Bacillus sp. BP-3 TaxID=3022773 RepID=UPI0023304BC6|nr:ABC transporter permease subunit [Bacillus sp. BP-3]MDC2865176.1 ABC transporter permease subunit [Bacillus sp. BP-3]